MAINVERKRRQEIQQEIVAHAARWASNIIVEAVGNHASALSPAQRECLKRATAALSEFQRLPRPE